MNDYEKKGKDLRDHVPEPVLENQRPPTGKGLLIEVDGLLHMYHHDEHLALGERCSRRLKAEQGWFETLVKHAPTIGTFYENMLRSLLNETIPSKLKAGTGFIFDPNKNKSSKQIDILVYNSHDFAPLYSSGEFIVVSPEMAVSQSEVKKTLLHRHIRDIIRTTLLSYAKYDAFERCPFQQISVFSYDSKIMTDKIFNMVVSELTIAIKALCGTANDGSNVTFGINGLVLPTFYFFDRSDYIQTKLIKSQGIGAFSVEVTQHTASHENSLNEYLESMAPTLVGSNDFDKKNLRTLPIHNYGRRELIPNNIFAFRNASMLRLADIFRDDKDLICNFRVNGVRPFGVFIPCGIDVKDIRGFKEFINLSGLRWHLYTQDDA